MMAPSLASPALSEVLTTDRLDLRAEGKASGADLVTTVRLLVSVLEKDEKVSEASFRWTPR